MEAMKIEATVATADEHNNPETGKPERIVINGVEWTNPLPLTTEDGKVIGYLHLRREGDSIVAAGEVVDPEASAAIEAMNERMKHAGISVQK